ncbi:MAG TPA: LacI family DNA-binding transcriptional regulator [Paracoccaceae bacterium]|nr:LacI family DNA-binding transcriptional regulator [Paracoccaceae bacterium]
MKTRKPVLTDIAREAGVSIATASRAMNEPGLVQAETLRKVREVMARLGYTPNRKARALASGRSQTIGVVVPTVNSAIFAQCLQAMQRVLYADGYLLLVASHEYDPVNETMAVSQLISHGVDGLILVGAARPDATWRLIDDAGLPVVQLWAGRPDRDRVVVDNHAAGGMIARHLIDFGHRDFAVICGHLQENDRQRARLAGVRDALADAGMSLDAGRVIEAGLSIGSGREACRALLELRQRPTAVLGLVDLLAVGAIYEVQRAGLEVPRDISVAGIDNAEFSVHIAPSLTTVSIPAARIGQMAAQRMVAILSGDAEPRETTLDIALVRRQSTGPHA